MTSSLFSDSAEMESMFSPASMFIKAEELPPAAANPFNDNGRRRTDNKRSSNEPGASPYAFSTINGISKPTSYPLSISTDVTVPMAACFAPSEMLASPQDAMSPQFDFGVNWDPLPLDDEGSIVQTDPNGGWTRPSLSAELNRSSYQARYGQLTPPSGLSPDSHVLPTPFVEPLTPEKSSEEKHKKSSGSITAASKRRSKTSKDDASAPPAKRSRKGRKSTSKSAITIDPQEDVKRERFLERNRVAASKCRQKKKEWTSALEEDERQQKALNTYLQRCVAQLKEELLFLKGECLRHSDCDCVAIREHMRSTIPFMVRPAQSLYDTNPFASNGGNRPTTSSSAGDDGESPSMMSMSTPSGASAMSGDFEDDDMRSLLSASLTNGASD